MTRFGLALVVGLLLAGVASAQTPQPFPGAGQPPRGTQPPPRPPAPAPTPAREQPADSGVPTEATLGLPIYPTAEFVVSYDAGRGQRYYIFGSTATFPEVVAFYRLQLKTKGDLVFEQPATHMFEVGRFRQETMAFPPGVTVKDYTWGGSAGYPNPKRGAATERFPTLIMVVPPPPGQPAAR
jgi:hypothetical protein